MIVNPFWHLGLYNNDDASVSAKLITWEFTENVGHDQTMLMTKTKWKKIPSIDFTGSCAMLLLQVATTVNHSDHSLLKPGKYNGTRLHSKKATEHKWYWDLVSLWLMYYFHWGNRLWPLRASWGRHSKLNQTQHVLRVLPAKSQHTTTTLTWSFNDAYKSQWGEMSLRIPRLKHNLPH